EFVGDVSGPTCWILRRFLGSIRPDQDNWTGPRRSQAEPAARRRGLGCGRPIGPLGHLANSSAHRGDRSDSGRPACEVWPSERLCPAGGISAHADDRGVIGRPLRAAGDVKERHRGLPAKWAVTPEPTSVTWLTTAVSTPVSKYAASRVISKAVMACSPV